ncbi:DUF4142 domain-containing protein [Hyalangium versicolor]|uniref:DUF4142 domain-containing protein n=1 Tax=Hyalangium versicolor TaxID=2861190 RepID=UPI001CCB317E|nr:DUF4142 domain-containing protein [Hyalangium versicolor]
MKRMIQGLLLAGSLMVGGSALAQANTQGQASKDTSATPGKSAAKGGMVEHLGFKVPADEKAMLERIHHANQQEIQLGKLAQQNAQSQDVKSYGDMLVKDHTSADQQVMAYAQKKGLKLGEPKPLDDVERRSMAAGKANMEKLQVLKGVPFDACFLASMVGDHDAVLGELMAGQQSATDAGLTPLLQQLATSVTQHRQQAYSLLGRNGPGATSGVGGSGDVGSDVHHDMGSGTGGAGDTNKGTKSPGDKNTLDPGSGQKKY